MWGRLKPQISTTGGPNRIKMRVMKPCHKQKSLNLSVSLKRTNFVLLVAALCFFSCDTKKATLTWFFLLFFSQEEIKTWCHIFRPCGKDVIIVPFLGADRIARNRSFLMPRPLIMLIPYVIIIAMHPPFRNPIQTTTTNNIMCPLFLSAVTYIHDATVEYVESCARIQQWVWLNFYGAHCSVCVDVCVSSDVVTTFVLCRKSCATN